MVVGARAAKTFVREIATCFLMVPASVCVKLDDWRDEYTQEQENRLAERDAR